VVLVTVSRRNGDEGRTQQWCDGVRVLDLVLTLPRQGGTVNELILLLGQTALVLAGVACCVGFVVVIVSGLTWSVRKLKELQRL
jgi:hypothetical protein